MAMIALRWNLRQEARRHDQAAAAFVSAREHRRLMQKRGVVDLLDEEIRYVGAR